MLSAGVVAIRRHSTRGASAAPHTRHTGAHTIGHIERSLARGRASQRRDRRGAPMWDDPRAGRGTAVLRTGSGRTESPRDRRRRSTVATPAETYAARLDVDYPDQLDRLTTLFRL